MSFRFYELKYVNKHLVMGTLLQIVFQFLSLYLKINKYIIIVISLPYIPCQNLKQKENNYQTGLKNLYQITYIESVFTHVIRGHIGLLK